MRRIRLRRVKGIYRGLLGVDTAKQAKDTEELRQRGQDAAVQNSEQMGASREIAEYPIKLKVATRKLEQD